MNRPAGKSIGITLPLAAAILVALVAIAFSFSPGVEADKCVTDWTPSDTHTDKHKDSAGVACNETGHDLDPLHTAISSTEPGAAVAIRLYVTAKAEISGEEKITVDFSGPSADSGFIVSSKNISTKEVTIHPDGSDGFSPSTVSVQGEKVVLTVPDDKLKGGDYTITFSEKAGIKNPYYAGNHAIAVSSDVLKDNPDINTVVIDRITTITPEEGPHGDTFKLTGKGYAKGTVTIFDAHPDDGDAEILATVETGTGRSRGTFAVDLTARNRPGSLSYKVWTKDSEGAIDDATFRITSTTSFEPARVIAGTPLKINVADWQDPDKGVAAVRIAGQTVYIITEVTEYGQCIDYTGRYLADAENVLSVVVMVPDDILPGEQTVSLYDYDQLLLNGVAATTPPCQDGQEKGEHLDSNLTARLKRDAIPMIQETVRVNLVEVPDTPRGQNIIEVDGGWDRELELEVTPPRVDGDGYLDEGDQIEITLPGFDLSGAVFESEEERERIKLSGSDDSGGLNNAPIPAQVDVDILGGKLTLTLPGNVPVDHGAGEYLIITIQKGTGILTPEIPRGKDTGDEGYLVGITLVDRAAEGPKPNFATTDENIVEVKNPISSTVPSNRVRVELVANAEVKIGSGEEIVVDFLGPSADSEFVVPSSISTTRVTIHPDGENSFKPSDVSVQGARVILTIPSGTTSKVVKRGEFTIIFSNSARIRNPFAAGHRVITVSSFVEGDKPDVITAVIKRTTTIDPLEGPRGTEFTLRGKGYARGTITVYHDADGDEQIDAGETLASEKTVRGAFSIDLKVRGEPGDLVYPVRTRDSEGVDEKVEFFIRTGMFFDPARARVGWPLKITVSDWQDIHQEVAAVLIAGEDAYIAAVREYEECFDYTGVFEADSDRVVSFEVVVPRNVPAGEQTVSLYDHKQLNHYQVIDGARNGVADKGPCADLPEGKDRGARISSDVKAQLKADPIAITKATIEIDTQDLELSPSSAARGQRVTITGSGFTRAARGSDHIESVWIGGRRVVDDHSELEVGSNGDIAFAVTVPLGIADGENEVRIEGADFTLGQATLRIPEAAVTLEPGQGQRGTEFQITGSGFIAGEPVIVTYGPAEGESSDAPPLGGSGLLADSQGGFELTFKVPVIAEVGKRYVVKAVSKEDAWGVAVLVDAETTHFIPEAVITTTPESVSPGDYLNISAQYLPPFTLVGPIKISGIPVVPGSEVATDEDGAFETKVLVPHISYGDQTLLVQVAGVIVPHIVNLAAPPRSGPPGQVFKYLIRAGALAAVWNYDNETQRWGLFDPLLSGELAALNDLSEVNIGDIVWVNLSNPQHFQGTALAEGWSLISLK